MRDLLKPHLAESVSYFVLRQRKHKFMKQYLLLGLHACIEALPQEQYSIPSTLRQFDFLIYYTSAL